MQACEWVCTQGVRVHCRCVRGKQCSRPRTSTAAAPAGASGRIPVLLASRACMQCTLHTHSCDTQLPNPTPLTLKASTPRWHAPSIIVSVAL